MPRRINHEALLSPVIRTQTPFGVRPACEALVRDLTGGAPLRYARYVEVKSTDMSAEEVRKRLQRALRIAYGAENVTTISNTPQWERTFRFVFDEGDPQTSIGPADLPFVEPDDLAG